jgi:hypothetical protein
MCSHTQFAGAAVVAHSVAGTDQPGTAHRLTKECGATSRSDVNAWQSPKAQSTVDPLSKGPMNRQEASMSTSQPHEPTPLHVGTLDGSGASDHDQPYQFGRRPNARAPFPFNERQYARLLVLRSRLQERPEAHGPARLTVLPGGLLPTAA